jgi:hypothetical protein
VEFKLKPSERDRFVMWSAPLKSMYSGDYHYKNGTVPQWGDIYMNLFQQANPNGTGLAAPNTYTATFGELGEPLGLGKAFNLRVFSTSLTKDGTLVFPQSNNSYTDANARYYNLVRTDRAKFITHGYPLNSSGVFAMPVTPNEGMTLIQVVNPYLAYLRFPDFRGANYGTGTANLSNGYYIWDGEINTGFTVVSGTGNRYVTTPPSPPAFLELIPPLQSFFVAKPDTIGVKTLNMSPLWTTTAPVASYSLRAGQVTGGGILRIKASQDSKTGYALLVHSHNAFTARGEDDMPVLIYDEIPLTVYSLTPLRELMAIQASNFQTRSTVDLGLRIKDAGETRLEFSELETFGYNVFLIDKQLDREIDLQQTPAYTFMVAKQGSGALELNDRFSLRMEYTGKGVLTGVESVAPPALRVFAQDGYICTLECRRNHRLADIQPDRRIRILRQYPGGTVQSQSERRAALHCKSKNRKCIQNRKNNGEITPKPFRLVGK